MNLSFVLPRQGVICQQINGRAFQVFMLAGISTVKNYNPHSSFIFPLNLLISIAQKNKVKKTEKNVMDFALKSLFRVGCKAMSLMLAADNE